MALALLNELSEEITRLYIAGSALSVGDPRLKKYIPQLQKLAEKAPVFKVLEEKLSSLIQGENKTSPESLMEAGILLYSLRYTLGTTEIDGEIHDMEYAHKKFDAKTSYSVKGYCLVYEAITQKKSIHVFHELFESGQYKDLRLFEKYCEAITDEKTKTSKYIEETIIPAIGADMLPFIEKALDLNGGKRHARLLSILYQLKGKEIRPLLEKALSESSKPVMKEALRIKDDML
jgi:hypothetical protein